MSVCQLVVKAVISAQLIQLKKGTHRPAFNARLDMFSVMEHASVSQFSAHYVSYNIPSQYEYH